MTIHEFITEKYTIYACAGETRSRFYARQSFPLNGRDYVILQAAEDKTYLTMARWEDGKLVPFTDETEWDNTMAKAGRRWEDFIEDDPGEVTYVLAERFEMKRIG